MGKRTLNRKLKVILEPAYLPCAGADKGHGCHGKVTIDAKVGHLPRGFFGATGTIEDVELVLVVAEPGDPSEGGKLDATKELDETYKITTDAFDLANETHRTGKFHKNVRHILDLCFPNTKFEDQLKKVWFTESVLCSAEVTTHPIDRAAEDECGERYLRAQLDLFPHAVIAALGNKASERIARLKLKDSAGDDRVVIKAYAAAPPGCNHKPAEPSWQKVAAAVQKNGIAPSIVIA